MKTLKLWTLGFFLRLFDDYTIRAHDIRPKDKNEDQAKRRT